MAKSGSTSWRRRGHSEVRWQNSESTISSGHTSMLKNIYSMDKSNKLSLK